MKSLGKIYSAFALLTICFSATPIQASDLKEDEKTDNQIPVQTPVTEIKDEKVNTEDKQDKTATPKIEKSSEATNKKKACCTLF
jgi:hypothetical protein